MNDISLALFKDTVKMNNYHKVYKTVGQLSYIKDDEPIDLTVLNEKQVSDYREVLMALALLRSTALKNTTKFVDEIKIGI